MFSIKSSNSDAELKFLSRDEYDFVVEFRRHNVCLVRDVYYYSPVTGRSDGLAGLFDHLALQAKPWTDEQSWESHEGEFRLEAQCNDRGNVSLLLTMRFGNGVAEPWDFNATLITDLGALPQIAQSARKFFEDDSV